MALFSRRPKNNPDARHDVDAVGPASESAVEAGVEPVPGGSAVADAPAVDEKADAAASVSISMTSFQGLGAQRAPQPSAQRAPQPSAQPAPQPRPRPVGPPAPELAPPATESVPGLRDNVLVRDALIKLADGAPAQELLNVARQLLQGHLYLRVKGDARALLAEGKELPLAMVTIGDRRFALAYSSGTALQASVRADGDAETSAMGQPVLHVLRHVIAGPYEGLIIDHSSAPARAVLPKALLEKVVEQVDSALTIKTLLAGERTPETTAAVVDALARVPLWVAVGQGEDGRPGIAEGRTPDGARYMELHSHPLEVAARGRGDQAAPLTGAQLAGALNGDPSLSGVVVDPAGPWIRLSRDDLAPLLAPVD